MKNVTPSNSPRYDAFLFYSLAVSSFLESTVATYVENLFPFFKGRPDILSWLSNVWLPEESEHGTLTKIYVNDVWPEFDWEYAYQLFFKRYGPLCNYKNLRPSPALESLSRCVTEAEATMIYRCIACYTNDRRLKELMNKMSTDEARHYSYFYKMFSQYDYRERNSNWKKGKAIVNRSKLVRDKDVSLAFEPLNSCWKGDKPFLSLEYKNYLEATGRVMKQYFQIKEAKQLLFQPVGYNGKTRSVLSMVLTLILKYQYQI